MVTRSKSKRSIGTMIDELYALRASRLELEKKVEELKAGEVAAREEIITRLKDARLGSGSGVVATATIVEKHRWTIEDWPSFWKWAKRDLGGNYVQKRVAAEALSEYVAANPKKPVPGVGSLTFDDLSVTKVGAKKGAALATRGAKTSGD